MDLNGYQVFFTSDSDGILVKPLKETPPIPSIEEIPPIPPIFDIPSLKPLRKMKWSTFNNIDFFK